MTLRIFSWRALPLALTLAVALLGHAASAEEPTATNPRLSLTEARERARAASPDLATARERVAVARGLEHQAGAFPNPSLVYSREQTSRGGETNREDIAGIEQRVEIGGQRGLRQQAARLRREAAEERLRAAELELDFEVARAYAEAVGAGRKATYAAAAAETFRKAREISARRRERGEISGYEDRRTALEAARYAALRAEAERARRSARDTLAMLLAPSGRVAPALGEALEGSLEPSVPREDLVSLRERGLVGHPEIRAAERERQAAELEARLARRGTIPDPVVGLGYKREQGAEDPGSFDGFAAEVSIQVPLWDRRAGAVEAARADARRLAAELRRTQHGVGLSIERAWADVEAASEQLEAIGPQLGSEADAALRAARTAYEEGEITLVAWLDAVRAYYEAESTYAGLLADSFIRRAALERAAGGSLF